MEAINLLKQDHREVERLFSRFEGTGDESLVQKICQKLKVHTTIEEEIVYPVLEQVDPKMAGEANREHDEADQLIRKIERLGRGDERLAELMQQLKKAVEHHVTEEENEVFPEMQQAVPDQVKRMGRPLAERKQELMGRNVANGDLHEMTKDELYDKAREADIEGRSSMRKNELVDALAERR